MKTKILSTVGLALGLALGGCASLRSPEEQAKLIDEAQARGRAALAAAATTVTPADRLPVFFDAISIPASSGVPAEIWQNIFNGAPNAPARLSIVEERGGITYENFGFSGRLHYNVTAALRVGDQTQILRGEAEQFTLGFTGNDAGRAMMERALLSISRQARVYLKP